MKATRKNLDKYWILKTKILSLMEYWLEAWFFYKQWEQTMQNISCELSAEDFIKSYNDYINDTDCISTRYFLLLLKKADIWEDIYLLEKTKNWAYCYFPQRKSFEKRIFKVIKNKTHMRYGNEWHRIEL